MAVFKGTINGGSSIKVTFSANSTNSAGIAFLLGWIPANGQAVPESQFQMVQPSGAGTLSSNTPDADAAHSLDIRIQAASLTDGGLLEVFEGDIMIAREAVTGIEWMYAVV